MKIATNARRKRDPQATRAAILDAAKTVLAEDGPDALSLSKVAHLAKVNRGTAYQHFKTREDLIEATLQWVSQHICAYVFEDSETGKIDPAIYSIEDVTRRLVEFAIENPELGRIWLFNLLSSDELGNDPFYKLIKESTATLAASDCAQESIDSEALSVLMLAGYFLWPVWVRAHSEDAKSRQEMAGRMTREVLRLLMYGVMRPERHRTLAALLKEDETAFPAISD